MSMRDGNITVKIEAFNDRGEKVLDYMKAITEKAGFGTQFQWQDDRVVVTAGAADGAQ